MVRVWWDGTNQCATSGSSPLDARTLRSWFPCTGHGCPPQCLPVSRPPGRFTVQGHLPGALKEGPSL